MRIVFFDDDGSMTFTEKVADWSILPFLLSKEKKWIDVFVQEGCGAGNVYWNVAVS